MMYYLMITLVVFDLIGHAIYIYMCLGYLEEVRKQHLLMVKDLFTECSLNVH
jgi:hypothetical protein